LLQLQEGDEVAKSDLPPILAILIQFDLIVVRKRERTNERVSNRDLQGADRDSVLQTIPEADFF
jgi:hypothetical protein